MVLMLLADLIILLVCLQWVPQMRGWRLILGAALLLVWLASVIPDKVRLLRYDGQKAHITPGGVSVGKRAQSELPWEEIREVEIRDPVDAVTHPLRTHDHAQIVFSDRVLTERHRMFLCSDADPWLPNDGIVQLPLWPIENDDALFDWMKQRCPLLARAAENYVPGSVSFAAEETGGVLHGAAFSRVWLRAHRLSAQMVWREALWIVTVILAETQLSGVFGDQSDAAFDAFLLGTALLAVVTTISVVLRRRKLRREVGAESGVRS